MDDKKRRTAMRRAFSSMRSSRKRDVITAAKAVSTDGINMD